MLLVVKTVLVITLSLPNGFDIVYEVDGNTLSQRVKFVDDVGNPHDILIIRTVGNSFKHEFDLTQDVLSQKKIVDVDFSAREEPNFAEFDRTPFYFKDKNQKGFCLSKKLINGACVQQYFVQILELKDILEGEVDRFPGFPIIEDWMLHAYISLKPIIIDNPIKLKTTRKSKFSKIVQEHIDIIASSN